jgi:hypothetical protein
MMIYTFVLGANVSADIKVGDTHTWNQMRPNVGSYGNARSGGPDKTIAGTVVEIRDGMWVKIEAESVPALNV